MISVSYISNVIRRARFENARAALDIRSARHQPLL